MDHRGNRRGRAGAHVSRGASNRRGGGNAAKEWRDDIAQALADQLTIRFVFGAGHTVEHHRAEQ